MNTIKDVINDEVKTFLDENVDKEGKIVATPELAEELIDILHEEIIDYINNQVQRWNN